MPVIALLTDFGLQDPYVGAMKGAILCACPGATLVDVLHDVPAHDVYAGALALDAAYRHFPGGTVFVAVVDPGVGSDRRPIGVGAGRWLFVGPDNGLRSLGRVNATFDDLSSMLLFLHLQPQYRNRTWVVVDAGEQKKQTIDSLIQRYNASGWNADQFLQWSKHDFEEYYPPAFRQDFLTAKATNNNQELRSHKTRILMELLNSAKQNPETVKQELATSAQEVIELLHKVSVAISN